MAEFIQDRWYPGGKSWGNAMRTRVRGERGAAHPQDLEDEWWERWGMSSGVAQASAQCCWYMWRWESLPALPRISVLTYKTQLTFPVSNGCCEIKISHTWSAWGRVDAQQVPLPPGRWGAFNKRDKYNTRSVGIVTCSFSSWWSVHNVKFSVYISVGLISTCTFLCISSPEVFSSGKTETPHPLNNNSPFPPPSAPGDHRSAFCLL